MGREGFSDGTPLARGGPYALCRRPQHFINLQDGHKEGWWINAQRTGLESKDAWSQGVWRPKDQSRRDHRPSTRHPVSSWRKRRYGTRPYDIRHSTRYRSVQCARQTELEEA